MGINRKMQTLKYVISDLLAAAAAWSLFYLFRKAYIEPMKFGYEIPIVFDSKFYMGLFFIPVFWLLLYYLVGTYRDVYRKSRLKELGQTITLTFIGVILLFFALLLDDTVSSYKNYYLSLGVLFSLHFTLTYFPRLIITARTIKKIHQRKIGFNTIMIGGNENAYQLYKDMESAPRSTGNRFVGFINAKENKTYELAKELPHLGNMNELNEQIKKHEVEEVIIALEPSEREEIKRIVGRLEGQNVIIKVIPDMYDILTGSVKMSTIYGAPLIRITHDIMPEWQKNVKRMLDVLFSLILIILLLPLYIFLTLGVLLTSKGPVLYHHERIGKHGRPFKIYKFRSMFTDAEKNGPALSSKDDKRVTRFGRFMRKFRLDEIPQFYNVLIGDMSLVGPRPERQYFIDKITEKAPHFVHLLKVRPGITSWGMVKFGYAENVEEMITRMKYDIIYIENMSLYLDFKIMIHTIRTIFEASGK